MCHEASIYILEIGSSTITGHTVHIYQDVSAKKPGFRAGVMIPIDTQVSITSVSKGFSPGLSDSSCPHLEHLKLIS